MLLFILGRPKPTVVWWKDGKILDSVVDTISIGSPSKFTVNRFFINEVTRSLWGTKLECRAQSEQMTSPIVREVPLDVYREYRVVFSRRLALTTAKQTTRFRKGNREWRASLTSGKNKIERISALHKVASSNLNAC